MKRSILMFLCECAVGAAEPVELRFEKLQSIEGSAKWDWWQVLADILVLADDSVRR